MTGEGTAVPAPGQLVTVRNRPWVAADVLRGEVASSDPSVFTGRAPHLVSLVSVEDDARGEELRVVWELETGARAHDSTVLPSPEHGFDEPAELDAFLHAVRWGAIASADVTALQAPFRSGVQILDYQLDPVVRALSMPRTNLLIADDVGLGKTIEAGLVMQELMLRHRARTMLIVCPAGLTRQWQEEMRDKFGLDFVIVNRRLLQELRRSRGLYVNPWTHHPRLIVSIDWLKRERPMRLLREVLPAAAKYPRAIDLLLVDEVHTCAPAGRGQYPVDSDRTRAIRELAPHCEHRLFLSATPHNGYLESFTALLELLDDQRFARGVPPNPEQLARVMVRRMKHELPKDWHGKSRFARRDLDYLEVGYSADEQDAHRLLNAYAESRRTGGTKSARAAADFVTTLLKRRLFSSPQAFANTVQAHLKTMSEKEDQVAASAATQRVLPTLFQRVEESIEDSDAAEDGYRQAEDEVLTAVRRGSRPLTAEERRMLTDLQSWGRSATDRQGGKLAALRSWLEPIVCPAGPAADWTPERVIIFTEYRDTQLWLFERLLAAQYPKERIALLYGGQDPEEREQIKNLFTEDPDLHPVRVLLATDSASEGINLQRHCHRVLHWEIPWNPNRLEQRNGRVDRHGQRAAVVEVRHFVPAGWQDREFDEGTLEDELTFLRMVADKVENIRADLGSAGDILAAQVERKMLGRPADWQNAEAQIATRAGKARLRVERDLAAKLQRLTEALAGSRTELDLTPETIEQVVRTALKLAHRKDLIPATAPPGFPSSVFWLPALPGTWAVARDTGLKNPVTGKERLVTFDQDAIGDRTDVVLLHLGHRLVEMCLRLLRAELWAQARDQPGAAKLSRVTARIVPGDLLRTPAVVAHGRVVVTGAEGTRLHEEVITAGGLIEEGKLKRANKDEVDRWLAAASADQVPESIRTELAALWPNLSEPLVRLLNARSSDRVRSMHANLTKRCVEEIAAIETVLDELHDSIRDALYNPVAQQPTLFEDEEQNQLRADRAALTARLEAIPDQRERETEALRRRYADPTPRWFPAAVTFLVPAAIARGAR
ncbi:DISARM system SNF2-like helicase DrmD [Crossiella sp. NPDC003009]